jgi:hypothetical protein
MQCPQGLGSYWEGVIDSGVKQEGVGNDRKMGRGEAMLTYSRIR